ncbi:hypothetical protein KL907_000891 [Ogataea polymorpha]|nr:hypothetical protein KL906_000799 [Ogataea polymorpha]KAG7912689.1 hypothetical protein KL907_000891 [Ogataea polymorpha]KAG7919303.1 hypothetical protein KL927_001432 [Ogataea polymorpha]KAG7937139.1 hypothetical protein KL934_001342 [Ogataea polymorpha]
MARYVIKKFKKRTPMSMLTADGDLCSGVPRQYTARDCRFLPPDVRGPLADVPHLAAAGFGRHRDSPSRFRSDADRQACHPQWVTKGRSTRGPCDHASGPSSPGETVLPAASVSECSVVGRCCLAGPRVARILVEFLFVGADMIGRDK